MSNMLERLPSVEEMIAALSSPVGPEVGQTETVGVDELSVEDMIREMFSMMKTHHTENNVSLGGVRAQDTNYNSTTATYDGLPVTMQYNGGVI